MLPGSAAECTISIHIGPHPAAPFGALAACIGLPLLRRLGDILGGQVQHLAGDARVHLQNVLHSRLKVGGGIIPATNHRTSSSLCLAMADSHEIEYD